LVLYPPARLKGSHATKLIDKILLQGNTFAASEIIGENRAQFSEQSIENTTVAVLNEPGIRLVATPLSLSSTILINRPNLELQRDIFSGTEKFGDTSLLEVLKAAVANELEHLELNKTILFFDSLPWEKKNISEIVEEKGLQSLLSGQGMVTEQDAVPRFETHQHVQELLSDSSSLLTSTPFITQLISNVIAYVQVNEQDELVMRDPGGYKTSASLTLRALETIFERKDSLTALDSVFRNFEIEIDNIRANLSEQEAGKAFTDSLLSASNSVLNQLSDQDIQEIVDLYAGLREGIREQL